MLFAFFLIASLLKTGQMTIQKETLRVEIADTPAAHAKGLMGRESLEEGEGMLFVYPSPSTLTFWMKNVTIPLAIGFFDENQELFHVEEMGIPKEGKPLILYTSPKKAQYALEVPQGWFHRHKINHGDRFSLHDLE